MTDALAAAKTAFLRAEAARQLMECKERFVKPSQGPESAAPHVTRRALIAQQRRAVAALTRKVMEEDTTGVLFNDMFVGDVDPDTNLPATPSQATLRRLHVEHVERSHAVSAREDLDHMLDRLADNNRSRLDSLSTIKPGRHRPTDHALAEIECQVLLSYVMQGCAVFDGPIDAGPESFQRSIEATTIAGNESRIVPHASRVAGGRVSSGTKSSPITTTKISSTPSSGNRRSTESAVHSSLLSANRSGPESSHKSHEVSRGHSAPIKESGSSSSPRRTQQSDASGATNDSVPHYGFETRGNVRFNESQPAETPQPPDEATSMLRPEAMISHTLPTETTDAPVASTLPAESTAVAGAAAESQQLTQNATALTQPSVSRKPTGKFAKDKDKKKSMFSCFGNDAN